MGKKTHLEELKFSNLMLATNPNNYNSSVMIRGIAKISEQQQNLLRNENYKIITLCYSMICMMTLK
jgi:hypothetical protein